MFVVSSIINMAFDLVKFTTATVVATGIVAALTVPDDKKLDDVLKQEISNDISSSNANPLVKMGSNIIGSGAAYATTPQIRHYMVCKIAVIDSLKMAYIGIFNNWIRIRN